MIIILKRKKNLPLFTLLLPQQIRRLPQTLRLRPESVDWKAQKEAQAKERKRQNDLKRTEERIETLETRCGEIDELMTHEDVYSNSVRCQELAKEKDNITAELETLYEQWESLAE